MMTFIDVLSELVFLDTETNGLDFTQHSVLCVAAKKVAVLQNHELLVVDDYLRYYYRIEEINPVALEVNKLTDDEITKRRGDATYPRYYKDDKTDIMTFIGNASIVGHNIGFDIRFLGLPPRKTFCTSTSNKSIAPDSNKFPSLRRTSEFYNVEYNENSLHDAMYDVDVCMKIFEAMLKQGRQDVLDFLGVKPVLSGK